MNEKHKQFIQWMKDNNLTIPHNRSTMLSMQEVWEKCQENDFNNYKLSFDENTKLEDINELIGILTIMKTQFEMSKNCEKVT